MTDLFLKFPSREVAVQIGIALGYTTINAETGEPETTPATLSMAIHVIGELMLPTGETTIGDGGQEIPVLAGDGNWWVMVRILDQTPIPPEVQPYVIVPDEADQTQPNHKWN